MSWHDFLGSLGVLLIIVAYFLLQRRQWSTGNLAYSVANSAGASLILVSLIVEFNLSAFLVELFWLLISLYGVWEWRRSRTQESRVR